MSHPSAPPSWPSPWTFRPWHTGARFSFFEGSREDLLVTWARGKATKRGRRKKKRRCRFLGSPQHILTHHVTSMLTCLPDLSMRAPHHQTHVLLLVPIPFFDKLSMAATGAASASHCQNFLFPQEDRNKLVSFRAIVGTLHDPPVMEVSRQRLVSLSFTKICTTLRSCRCSWMQSLSPGIAISGHNRVLLPKKTTVQPQRVFTQTTALLLDSCEV